MNTNYRTVILYRDKYKNIVRCYIDNSHNSVINVTESILNKLNLSILPKNIEIISVPSCSCNLYSFAIDEICFMEARSALEKEFRDCGIEDKIPYDDKTLLELEHIRVNLINKIQEKEKSLKHFDKNVLHEWGKEQFDDYKNKKNNYLNLLEKLKQVNANIRLYKMKINNHIKIFGEFNENNS